MTKTLVDYTQYKLGTGSTVELFESKYGERLEKLDRADKCYLLYAISTHLKDGQVNTVSNKAYDACEYIWQFSREEMEGLIEALISQIRHG